MDLKRNSEHNLSQQDRKNTLYPPVNLHSGQHLHGFEVKAVTPD